MDFGKALKRIWQTWKFAFVLAIILYGMLFYWALNYEGHRKGGKISLEEPIELFNVNIFPDISVGVKTYTLNITNNQDYTIHDLTIEFSGNNFQKLEDFSHQRNGEVSGGSSVSYSYPVYYGARAVDIILDDSEVITGLTDINLYIQNENSGLTKESINQGNHEEIHLTEDDITNMGYGNYIVTVAQNSNWRSVSFQLIFSITYNQVVLQQNSNAPITPGQTMDFMFAFDLVEEQISDLSCKIDANLKLSNDLSLNTDMTFNSDWELIEETRPIPEEFIKDKPWGPVDLTGTSSAILYLTTVILGFAFYIHVKIEKIFIPKNIRRGHCFISLVTLILVLVHISIAVQKDWDWGSPGLRFAQMATIGLVCFTIFGFFDVEIIKAYGRKKWRLIHIIFTIKLGSLIILHFGLMGDHLGWLI